MKKIRLVLITLLFGLLGALNGYSEGPAELPKKPILKWAADAESGVPNVFYDPKDPGRLTGFEYEIAKAISDRLGRKLEFYANDWEMLVPGLQRKHYDILLNAVEATTWRAFASSAAIVLSEPYYFTDLQLIVPQKGSKVYALKDCAEKRVGILKQSRHAEKVLNNLLNVQVVIYDDEVKAFADLDNRRLDAVLLDQPESLYYALVHPNVRLVQEKITRLEYVVMLRAEDGSLKEEIDTAIQAIKNDGTLRTILERWGLWNREMAESLNDYFPSRLAPTELDSYVAAVQKNRTQRTHFYMSCLPFLAEAAWLTLKLSLTAMVFAIIMGFCLALLRIYGMAPIRWLVTLYIECVRGIPLLIQLLLIYYGLPMLSDYLPMPFSRWVCLPPFLGGVVALAINYSTYEAEIYRAGLLSVPRGQMEAARALGMTHFQSLLHVVLPQAIRIVIPPVTNDFVMLLQDSSLVSMITIVELTRAYQYLAATNFNYLGTGLLAAGFYLLLGFPFVRLARRLEKRLALGQSGTKR